MNCVCGFKYVFLPALTASVLWSVAVQDVPPSVPAAPVERQEAPARPPAPTLRLAPMPGFDDDAAYLRSITDRVSQLVGRAEAAGEGPHRSELLLAAANLILANQLEPACTKRLLHIAEMPDPAESKELAAALDRAGALIEQAEATLQTLRERNDLPEGWLNRSQRQAEVLKAFGAALRAYLVPVAREDAADEARRAASRLSPLLESDSRVVVEAATLWEACLRNEGGDRKPALSLLDLALADPRPEAMPYAFFARLLRCRLIAADGGHAAAIALLLQIEERTREWLEDEAEQDVAMRTAQLARLQVTADWHDHFTSPGQDAQRKWCADRIATLIEDAFGENADTVFRLSPAIPIIVLPPDPAAAPANENTHGN